MGNDVESSTGDDGGNRKHRHINYLGYPLGLGAAIATGVFGGKLSVSLVGQRENPTQLSMASQWRHDVMLLRCCCLIIGLVLGPMYYAPEEAKGLQYIPSMAIGNFLISFWCCSPEQFAWHVSCNVKRRGILLTPALLDKVGFANT